MPTDDDDDEKEEDIMFDFTFICAFFAWSAAFLPKYHQNKECPEKVIWFKQIKNAFITEIPIESAQ